MNNLPTLSPLQLFIIAFNAAFGVSLASLPRTLADTAKEDMWLPVVLGGAAFLGVVWMAVRLAAFFPGQTCIEYTRTLLGPVLGPVVNLALLAIILMVMFTILRTFGLAVNLFLLDKTPPQIAVLVMLLIAVYGAQYGLPPLVRLQQFISPPNYFLFTLIFLLGFTVIETDHYQPFLAEGLSPALRGIIPVWFSYSGPEIAIGLLYPCLTRKKDAFRCLAASVAALTCLYVLLVIIVQGILGPRETAHNLLPTLIAYREVEIPDTFIERLDGYFMIFWIPIVFTCIINWLHFAAFGAARLLRLECSRPVAMLLVPIVYYLVIAPPTYPAFLDLSRWTNLAVIAWGIGILPLLLLLAWRREKRRTAC